MKMKLLPLAVSALIVIPSAVYAAGPTVFGKINVAGENVDVDDGAASSDRWDITSNMSRIGVKGDAAINSQLKATYLVEFGYSADETGDGEGLTGRNRSVGLAGGFGALDVGAFDTPTKTTQNKVDLFNDQAGDLWYTLVGDVRANNIAQYTSPTMNGLTAKVAVMPGEEFDTGQPGGANDGLADATSLSVTYTAGDMYLALGHDTDMPVRVYDGIDVLDGTASDDPLSTSNLVVDITRAVAQYTMGNVQLGAILQQAEDVDDSDTTQDGYLLSAAYGIDKTTLKVQLASATNETAGGDTDVEAIGIGVDQKLSAQTTVYGALNMLSYEADGADEQTKDNLAVGIVHSF